MSVNALDLNPGTPTAMRGPGPVAAAGFAAALTTSAAPDERVLTGKGKADHVSGQIGLNVSRDGKPVAVVFFDEAGRKLTQTTFDAKSILKAAERLGIPLSDLNGLADQMDAAKIAHRPYALYAGTGSDHGIDLRDLASGGLGTAYDWRKDTNVAQKGPMAVRQLAETQALAERLGLKANPEVTTGGGLKLADLAPQVDAEGVTRPYVVTNGGWAAWYRTEGEAQAAANASRAALLNLTQQVVGGTKG